MLKVFDCSNSIRRPSHRGGGGPVENDVMRQLKIAASSYNVVFIDDATHADIIMTNDVYPEDIVLLDKPLLKRMDGMFYRPDDSYRNEAYNDAALKSKHVVFISEYAKHSFEWLFDFNIDSSVALNAASPSEFYDMGLNRESNLYAAACTNWNREEKRLSAILDLSQLSAFKGHICLIGTCNTPLPPNVKSVGYKTPLEMLYIFNRASGFINMSYRDPAPKVVCQALASGLPVFYAGSGGASESVKDCGYAVFDLEANKFEDNAPSIDITNEDWVSYLDNLAKYKKSLKERNFLAEYENMLESYFKQLHRLV